MRKMPTTHMLFVLLTLLLPLSVHAGARNFTTDEAATVASRFLKSLHNSSAVAERLTVHSIRPNGISESAEQPYYVFNAGPDEGFVILAGNQDEVEILGYSDKGNFDFANLPPQLRALLENYRERGGESRKAIRLSASEDEGKILPTANWGQGYPYNLETPMIGDEPTLTGCVATAMAIVMKYHNWPQNYDWDAMPMEQPESPVEPLCHLMADAGDAVLTHYGTGESSANMNWVGHRLQQRFSYSPDCQLISAENFTNDEWHRMLRENLDNDMPVIYNGTSEAVGHAFVIDGYKGGAYHVNWGWDGAYNGFYDLDALTPSENENYSSMNRMVIGIVPDKSGKVYSDVFCDQGYFWSSGAAHTAGAYYSIDSPGQNQMFDFSCQTINYPCDQNGELGLVLYDKDNNLKEVIATFIYTKQPDDFGLGLWSTNLAFADATIKSAVSPDDYITLATRSSVNSPWLEVLGTLEAQIKKPVSEIRKQVCNVTIINKIPEASVTYFKLDVSPVTMTNEEETFENVMGGHVAVSVDFGLENPQDYVICIDGPGLYGDQQLAYTSTAFITYRGDYTITIEKFEADIEKIVDVAVPGTLADALGDVDYKTVGSLIITGKLNALDFWFIRDNLKFLEKIDLSDVTIIGCDEIDPVEAFRITGEKQTDDCLPTYALTGLERLKEIKLPKTLLHIGSNSLMSLAIEKIDFPASVQSIGLNVLFDCDKLNTVIARMPQPPAINDCVFTGTMCPGSGVLYVPVGSAEAYHATPVWQDFAQIIEDDDPDTIVGEVEYEGLKYRIHGNALYLTGYNQAELPAEVIIPDIIKQGTREFAVYGIDSNAMQGAELKSFTMSNSITTVGEALFTGSTVERVVMSDNIKELPFLCIDGDHIEELHLPANAELIGNSLRCQSLKKLHIPAKLRSRDGYNGSVGMDFFCLEEITVDPENTEWSIHDGILFWNGLTHLVLVPNTLPGQVIIPDETTNVNSIAFCNEITELIFGTGMKTYNPYTVVNCGKLKHIEFSDDVLFTGGDVIVSALLLESFTIKNFIAPDEQCFSYLPELKYIYLMNDAPIDMSGRILGDTSENLSFFTASINPEVNVPQSSRLYVPGGVKPNAARADTGMDGMWKYLVDKESGRVKIEPLIEGLTIDEVTVNGKSAEAVSETIYSFDPDLDALEIIVDFTLHGRQKMTTDYTAEFNNELPDAELIIKTLTIDPESWSGTTGDKFTITASVVPAGETETTLSWTSSDSSIAEVDKEGNVTILRNGTCTVTVRTTDGSDLSAQCLITGLSGIDSIFADNDGPADIYDVKGTLIRKAADGDYARKLPAGVYILQFRHHSIKVLIH
ncbi:MAG: leucine-rich repeat protein [Bacteroidales bacterium]|nr:leucine-rich repeat protein [Bacteroidales bacterium]